jgi:hypothetical protein
MHIVSTIDTLCNASNVIRAFRLADTVKNTSGQLDITDDFVWGKSSQYPVGRRVGVGPRDGTNSVLLRILTLDLSHEKKA